MGGLSWETRTEPFNNMKSGCNKYKLKLSIMPINQISSHLKCKTPNINNFINNYNKSNKYEFLPNDNIISNFSNYHNLFS